MWSCVSGLFSNSLLRLPTFIPMASRLQMAWLNDNSSITFELGVVVHVWNGSSMMFEPSSMFTSDRCSDSSKDLGIRSRSSAVPYEKPKFQSHGIIFEWSSWWPWSTGYKGPSWHPAVHLPNHCERSRKKLSGVDVKLEGVPPRVCQGSSQQYRRHLVYSH